MSLSWLSLSPPQSRMTQCCPYRPAIYAIACPNVDPQFQYSLANWLHIAKVALFELQDPGVDARFCLLVS